MFIAVVPCPLDDFPGVTLVLLLRRVRQHAHVVVDVKVEQWARLAARLVDDKVVERVVLRLGKHHGPLPT